MTQPSKPKVFIGSSTEDLRIANAIHMRLERQTECTVWDQDVFKPSQFSLTSLRKALDDSDFGIFVMSPNDVTTMRNKTHATVRDNVILELGMFIGRLGAENTFFVVPRDYPNLHLPTDLLGLTPVDYDAGRTDNIEAAVSPACMRLLNRIEELSVKPESQTSLPVLEEGFRLYYHEEGRAPELSTNLVRLARSEVVIVGSSLRAFVVRFEQEKDSDFKEPIIQALERGVKFRIAVMDPNSRVMKDFARDRQDPRLIEAARASIETLRLQVNDFRKMKVRGSIQVRRHRRIPFGYALMIDPDDETGAVVATQYLPATKKAHSPTTALSKMDKPVAFKQYRGAIEDILKNSTLVCEYTGNHV